MYINDLSEQIQSSIWTFADDTKIYRPILTTEDQNILQNDLDIFTQWNKTWQGSLNISKCKHLSLGGPSVSRTYTIKNELEKMLIREKRMNIFKECLSFLDTRIELDQNGFKFDIFEH